MHIYTECKGKGQGKGEREKGKGERDDIAKSSPAGPRSAVSFLKII